MRAECARALLLVEKLADGETSSRERKEAEDHLARCVDCTAELQILTAMARHARASLLPEPPPSYWEHFPRRILERIARLEREENRGAGGFWSRLFHPERLRWHALGATLVVLVAVGVTALRMDPIEQATTAERSSPPGEPSLVGSARPQIEAVVPSEAEREKSERRQRQEAPEMARDEARPAGTPARPIEPPAAPGPPREEPAEGAASAESGIEVLPQTARLGKGRASDAEGLRSAAPIESIPGDPCEPLRQRRFLRESTGVASADARYELAACSLARFEAEPREDLRRLALLDGDAFLELEVKTERAEEIRKALEALRRN